MPFRQIIYLFVQLSVGSTDYVPFCSFVCSEEGDLFSWGSNAFHQLGRDTSGKFSVLPVSEYFSDNIKQISIRNSALFQMQMGKSNVE